MQLFGRSSVRGRPFVLASFGLALGCACNRTEEPAAPSPHEANVAGTSSAGGGEAAAPGGTTASGGSSSAAGAPPAATSVCTVPFQAAPPASKAETCPSDPSGNLALPLGRVVFSDAPHQPAVKVELARDDAARERGLMYRTSMAEDSGMLFSWTDERVRTFWMHNTCIPLDMLYITRDGVVSGILEQVPTLNEAPRRIDCPVAHVLELNAGWARAHGILPGMKVTIEG